MKERCDETNMVGRRWGNNCRIRNYHFGCCRLRRPSANNTKERGSQSHAVRPHKIGPYSSELAEQGSVTVEFAIVLPSVLLILALSLSVLALQGNRMGLIELAAEGSRAVARGESEDVIKTLSEERKIFPAPKASWIYEEESICLEISQNLTISFLGDILNFPVVERQCARKSGL